VCVCVFQNYTQIYICTLKIILENYAKKGIIVIMSSGKKRKKPLYLLQDSFVLIYNVIAKE